MSKYGLFSGPYFPAFGLNAERYSVFSILDTFHVMLDMVLNTPLFPSEKRS